MEEMGARYVWRRKWNHGRDGKNGINGKDERDEIKSMIGKEARKGWKKNYCCPIKVQIQ